MLMSDLQTSAIFFKFDKLAKNYEFVVINNPQKSQLINKETNFRLFFCIARKKAFI